MLKKIFNLISDLQNEITIPKRLSNPIEETEGSRNIQSVGWNEDKLNYSQFIQAINEYENDVAEGLKFLEEHFNYNWSYDQYYLDQNEVLNFYKLNYDLEEKGAYVLPIEFEILSQDKLIFSNLDLELPKPPKALTIKAHLEKSEYYKLKRINENHSRCLNFIKTINHQKKIYQSKIGNDIKNARDSFKNKTSVNALALIKCAHLAYPLPQILKRDIEVYLDEAEKILLIEYEFPNYDEVDIHIKYSKIASPAQKKKIVKECLQSIAIRMGFIASIHNVTNLYESVAINISHKWFDKATGKEKQGVILSLYASTKEFSELNLSKIDPDACFKSLKGILTPSIENTSPIRPIFVMDKNDKRIVDTKNVAADLKEDENLAAMDWEDFESLVAQLFEWEFAKNGIEVKVTQASRDKGVDALLFDPDPLKGGKYVLQAKRYTRTVDVSAVRDLYGTMMNEGANKGIIITTSSYGKDAYDFAKDKPLSLVDGNHLLQLLAKHGKKYRINLEEARRLYKETL